MISVKEKVWRRVYRRAPRGIESWPDAQLWRHADDAPEAFVYDRGLRLACQAELITRAYTAGMTPTARAAWRALREEVISLEEFRLILGRRRIRQVLVSLQPDRIGETITRLSAIEGVEQLGEVAAARVGLELRDAVERHHAG